MPQRIGANLTNGLCSFSRSSRSIKDCRTKRAADWLKSLFQIDGTLKDMEELRDLLEVKPFCFDWFQNYLEYLLRNWNIVCFGNTDVALYACRYRLPPNLAREVSTPKAERTPASGRRKKTGTPGKKTPPSKTKAAVRLLREGTEALKHEHGEDPLESSRKAAAGVPRKRPAPEGEEEEGKVESPVEKKKPGGRFLDVSDDSSEEEEEDELWTPGKERVSLGRVPKKKKIRRPAPQGFKGPKPDPGIFDEEGKVLVKRPWSDEEKFAVVSGVEQLGMGKWAKIKEMYAEILRNRTSVQIKDCYRTMARNGTLPQVEEAIRSEEQTEI
jgi:hypothetical protein